MADVEAASGDLPPTPGAVPATAKSKRYAAYGRWTAIIIGAVALVRVAFLFVPSGLADCGDSNVQSALRSAIETASQLKVTGVTNIATLSHADKSATCSMHVAASDGSQADVAYRLNLAGGQTHFTITTVK